MDFSALQSAKKKVEVIQEKQLESFDDIYNQGLQYFHESEKTDDINLLKKAADKFTEAIKYKSTQPEPYFYLAYIFYVLGKDQLTIEYLKMTESIDNNFPRLKAFKKIVYEGRAKDLLNDYHSGKAVGKVNLNILKGV